MLIVVLQHTFPIEIWPCYRAGSFNYFLNFTSIAVLDPRHVAVIKYVTIPIINARFLTTKFIYTHLIYSTFMVLMYIMQNLGVSEIHPPTRLLKYYGFTWPTKSTFTLLDHYGLMLHTGCVEYSLLFHPWACLHAARTQYLEILYCIYSIISTISQYTDTIQM